MIWLKFEYWKFATYKPKTISQVKSVKGDETVKNEDVVLISKTKVHFEISTIAAIVISHSLLLTFNDHHRSSILTLHISALLIIIMQTLFVVIAWCVIVNLLAGQDKLLLSLSRYVIIPTILLFRKGTNLNQNIWLL